MATCLNPPNKTSKNIIKAQKSDGSSNDIILIPRIPMISKDSSFPVPFKRVQFPVLGAYYLTINRAQGQTLGRAGLYLPGSVFCHGHLYVGFGRCGDPKKFFVYADQSEFDNIRQHLDPTKAYTRNIIYPELLNNWWIHILYHVPFFSRSCLLIFRLPPSVLYSIRMPPVKLFWVARDFSLLAWALAGAAG